MQIKKRPPDPKVEAISKKVGKSMEEKREFLLNADLALKFLNSNGIIN